MAEKFIIPHPNIPTADIGLPKLKEVTVKNNENFLALDRLIQEFASNFDAVGEKIESMRHEHPYAPIEHTHLLSDVEGLIAALELKAPLIHTHPEYLTEVPVHGHKESEIYGLLADLAGKADIQHKHNIGDVYALQESLNGKASNDYVLWLESQMARVSQDEIPLVDGDPQTGAGVIGTSSHAARADHRHPVNRTTNVGNLAKDGSGEGGTALIGSLFSYAMTDHSHPLNYPSERPSGLIPDGTDANDEKNFAGRFGDVNYYADLGHSHALNIDLSEGFSPSDVSKTEASPGSSRYYAQADHVHKLPKLTKSDIEGLVDDQVEDGKVVVGESFTEDGESKIRLTSKSNFAKDIDALLLKTSGQSHKVEIDAQKVRFKEVLGSPDAGDFVCLDANLNLTAVSPETKLRDYAKASDLSGVKAIAQSASSAAASAATAASQAKTIANEAKTDAQTAQSAAEAVQTLATQNATRITSVEGRVGAIEDAGYQTADDVGNSITAWGAANLDPVKSSVDGHTAQIEQNASDISGLDTDLTALYNALYPSGEKDWVDLTNNQAIDGSKQFLKPLKIGTQNEDRTNISSWSIEMYAPNGNNLGGFIDFHNNGTSDDYTSRIIDDSKGLLLTSLKNVRLSPGDGYYAELNKVPPDNNSTTSGTIATLGWANGVFIRKSMIGKEDGVSAYDHDHGKIGNDGKFDVSDKMKPTDTGFILGCDTSGVPFPYSKGDGGLDPVEIKKVLDAFDLTGSDAKLSYENVNCNDDGSETSYLMGRVDTYGMSGDVGHIAMVDPGGIVSAAVNTPESPDATYDRVLAIGKGETSYSLKSTILTPSAAGTLKDLSPNYSNESRTDSNVTWDYSADHVQYGGYKEKYLSRVIFSLSTGRMIGLYRERTVDSLGRTVSVSGEMSQVIDTFDTITWS